MPLCEKTGSSINHLPSCGSWVCGMGVLFACFHTLFRLLIKVLLLFRIFLLNFGELIRVWICSILGGAVSTHIHLSGGTWGVSSWQVIYLQGTQECHYCTHAQSD